MIFILQTSESGNINKTRMHSSRMHTFRFSGHLGGCLPGAVFAYGVSAQGGVCPRECLPEGCQPRGIICLGRCLPGVICLGDVYPQGCLSWGCLPERFTLHLPRPRSRHTLDREADTPAVDRILDTSLWKHYLSATTVADGNMRQLTCISDSWDQLLLSLRKWNCFLTTESHGW